MDCLLPALVFCRSRKRVEGVAGELASTLGWDRVGAYHAGLNTDERVAIEAWFFAAEDAVTLASNGVRQFHARRGSLAYRERIGITRKTADANRPCPGHFRSGE